MKVLPSNALIVLLLLTPVVKIQTGIQQEADKLATRITKHHTSLFGVDNIFENEPSSKNIEEWNKIVALTSIFVKKNAFLEPDTKPHRIDTELISIMEQLQNLNKKIIMNLKDFYKNFFKSPNQDLFDKRNAATSMNSLIQHIKNLTAQTEKVRKTPNVHIHNAIIAHLLYQLALTLELTAHKIQNDLLK